ncbi:MAG TPA: DUF4097 family beta strand repeat-containing protein [Candidatus Angelobacter sp.]|nr:DUF4097 family beta strand repeat-containing protein [Candidatus Angelobacter sp.]
MNRHTQQHGFSRFSISLFVSLPVCIFVFVFASAGTAQAQNDHVVVNLSDPSRPAVVKVSTMHGEIAVKGYDGKDIQVDAHSRGDEGERENRPTENGMKRIPLGNSTGLVVEEENNQVRIGTEALRHRVDLVISVPRHTSLVLRGMNHGTIDVSDVEGDLDINTLNGEVMLKNISGSVVAHALNGKITANFLRMDAQKPTAFSSMNGAIDVTFPPDLKANLSIKSDRGEAYSDFDVVLQTRKPEQLTTEDNHSDGGRRGKYRLHMDNAVHGSVNGGGPEIQFKTFNGSIYIRKAGSAK